MMIDSFEKKILAFSREYGMFPEGSSVLIAYSGGADSTCLLHVLHELSAILHIRLFSMHVNHRLRREESERDEAFCRAEAGRLSVPFHAVGIDVKEQAEKDGLSVEEAARNLRYEALNAQAAELGAVLATGHHADDQAETILFHLFRGSGLAGLAGMEPLHGNLARPLLCVTRREIIGWLAGKGISYVTDGTNFCDDYARNYIRNRLLPEAAERLNEGASRHIVAAGQRCREADRYLREEAAVFLEDHAKRDEKSLSLPRRALKEKPQIFRRYAIMVALERLGASKKDLSERNYADLDKLLAGGNGLHLDLPNGLSADNRDGMIVLLPAKGGG